MSDTTTNSKTETSISTNSSTSAPAPAPASAPAPAPQSSLRADAKEWKPSTVSGASLSSDAQPFMPSFPVPNYYAPPFIPQQQAYPNSYYPRNPRGGGFYTQPSYAYQPQQFIPAVPMPQPQLQQQPQPQPLVQQLASGYDGDTATPKTESPVIASEPPAKVSAATIAPKTSVEAGVSATEALPTSVLTVKIEEVDGSSAVGDGPNSASSVVSADTPMSTSTTGTPAAGITPKPIRPASSGNKEWTKSAPPSSAASSANAVDSSAWKREPQAAPASAAEMRARSDGIQRYDKLELLRMNKLNKIMSDALKEKYGSVSTRERFPPPYKGINIQAELESIPSAEEAKLFAADREGMFKFEANRLADTEDPEVKLKKATLILNKLTVANFAKLSAEFMALGLELPDVMPRAIEIIIAKAQMEETFAYMYADLCKTLYETWKSVPASPALASTSDAASSATETASSTAAGASTAAAGEGADGGGDEEGGDDVAATADKNQGDFFRRTLVNKCSSEFGVDRTKLIEEIRSMDLPEDEREEKEIITKKKFTGHMRFVGELFMKELIVSKTVITCLRSLIETNEEQDIVCLVKLFETIGLKLSKKRKNKASVDEFFTIVQKLSIEHPSSRIRFLLMDLIVLKNNGWKTKAELEKPVKQEPTPGPSSSSSNPSPFSTFKPSNKPSTPRTQDVRVLAAAAAVTTSTLSPVTGGVAGGDEEWTTATTKSKSKRGPVPSAAPVTAAANARGGSVAPGGKFSVLNSPTKPVKGSNGPKASKDKDFKSQKPFGSRTSSSAGVEGNTAATSSTLESGSNKLFVTVPSNDAAAETMSEVATPMPPQWGEEGLDKDMQRKVKACWEEFAVTGLESEMLQDFAEIPLEALTEVVKYLFHVVVEITKFDERIKFRRFMGLLLENKVVTAELVLDAVVRMLHTLSDIAIDVPKAFPNFAVVLGHLVVDGIIGLGFLSSLPEENDFTLTPSNVPRLMGCVLASVAQLSDDATAEAAYRSAGIDLPSLIEPAPRESKEDAILSFTSEHKISFPLNLI